MAESRRKRPTKSKRAPKAKTKAPPADECSDAEAESAHVESLISTGEAAEVDSEGKLPPGATHELVKTEGEEPKVIRKRFSIT